MNVLVTGGTGFVGKEVVKGLLASGHQPRVLARRPETAKALSFAKDSGAELQQGDITNAESLTRALEGVHAVIHLVGIISEVGNATFENVHINGTRNVVEAARRSGVNRFVHMSALGTREKAVSRYHKSKWAAEEIVRRSDMDWTIFRPSLIYGPHDQFVNLFAKIIRWSPIVPVMGRKDARFQPVSVENVANAFVRALDEQQSVGKTFDLCGPERFTLAEMIDEIMRTAGKRRVKVRVPAWVARMQAVFLELLFPRLLRKAPPLNRDQLIMLEEDNVGDERVARELFALRKTSFKEGVSYLKRL